MRTITRNDIASARSACVWDLGNRVLYELCSKHLGHGEADEIVAKIWLIGRSYAASIERRRNATQAGDRFYEETVCRLCGNRASTLGLPLFRGMDG
jgi:hypothetical protein